MEAEDGISVIICTYNGADRLSKTLKHLVEQEFFNQINWEIIIVDNASEDDSGGVAERFWSGQILPEVGFKVIKEQRAGLSFARASGIDIAKFEYIIFCDDDNWLNNNYVSVAYNIISSNNKIGALGGQSIATSYVPLPDWFEKYKANYAVGCQATKSGDVTSRKFLWGSGIIIRKKLYNAAFKKNPSLLIGRNGSVLSSGEDSEICLRFIMMGYELHYSDQLKFQHFITEQRLTEDYNQRLQIGFYEAYDILKFYDLFLNFKKKTKSQKIVELLKSFLKLACFKKLMESEKLNLYLMTNYGRKGIHKQLAKINYIDKQINND